MQLKDAVVLVCVCARACVGLKRATTAPNALGPTAAAVHRQFYSNQFFSFRLLKTSDQQSDLRGAAVRCCSNNAGPLFYQMAEKQLGVSES